MEFPSIDFSFDAGQPAPDKNRYKRFVLVGTSHTGPLELTVVGSEQEATSLYGESPLAMYARYFIQALGKSVYALRLPVETAGQAFLVEPETQPTGFATAAVSGTPTNQRNYCIKITYGGPVLTARYALSTDGGLSYGVEQLVTTNQIALDSGISLVFDTDPNEDLAVDTVYRILCTEPQHSADVSGVIDSLADWDGSLVIICQGREDIDDVFASLDAACLSALSSRKFFIGLVPFRLKAEDESFQDWWSSATPFNGLKGTRCLKAFGQFTWGDYSLSASILTIPLISRDLSESAIKLSVGLVKLPAVYVEPEGGRLSAYDWLCVRKHQGFSYTYLVGDCLPTNTQIVYLWHQQSIDEVLLTLLSKAPSLLGNTYDIVKETGLITSEDSGLVSDYLRTGCNSLIKQGIRSISVDSSRSYQNGANLKLVIDWIIRLGAVVSGIEIRGSMTIG